MGKGEYDVGIGRWQEFSAPRGHPSVTRLTLALRAMPVAARVIGDGAMAAAGTLIQMTSHGGGAASLNRDEYFQVQPCEPGWRAVGETMCGGGYNIGQLWERPIHYCLFFGFAGRVRLSESSGLAAALIWRSDRCRYRLVVSRSAWPINS